MLNLLIGGVSLLGGVALILIVLILRDRI